MTAILVVDDEVESFRPALSEVLDAHELRFAGGSQEALAAVSAGDVGLVLLDVRMPAHLAASPEREGLACLQKLIELRPDVPVVMLSVFGDVDTVVEAIQRGAFHYITKPPDPVRLVAVVERALETRRLRDEVRELRTTIRLRDEIALASEAPPAERGSDRFGRLVGRGAAMREVYRRVERVAGTDCPVLILGASGTGKELVAREIHDRSPRRTGPFRAINCAAIPRELIESTLFGHVRGAFTGALERKGELELASGGTLLLDEIGELSLELQPKLLRAIEERKVQAVGSSSYRPTDVRILSATNRDILALVASGSFREDLYYRLNVVPLRIPALAEREGDVALLARHFVEELATLAGKPPPRLADATVARLVGHAWPGNVRELRHAIQRALVLGDGAVVEPHDLELDGAGPEGLPAGQGSELEPEAATPVAPATLAASSRASSAADALWARALAGESLAEDITQFRNRHGADVLANLLRRAIAREKDLQRAGRLLGFIPAGAASGDRESVKFRKWVRKLGISKREVLDG